MGGIIMDYNNYLPMVNSLSIKERISVLTSKLDANELENNIKKWRSRKGLLKDENFNNMIEENGFTREEFAFGIKDLHDLDQKSKENLNYYLVKQDWFNNMILIFESHDYKKLDKNFINTSYIFQALLAYVRKELDNFIKDIRDVEVTNQFIENLIESFYNELISRSQGVLIEDLHNFKEKYTLRGTTPTERYSDYIQRRFCNKKEIIEFFMTYPTFTRLIHDRTEFFIKNYKDLISHFNQEIKTIKQTFILKEDVFKLNNISTNSGDSHGGGKSVSIISLNNLELVYKPKNLLVAKKIRTIQSSINNMRDEELFYIVKGIYRENYTIEEKVNWIECVNEIEVKNYYRNFGELVAFAQIFKGNDLHYENIIAKGQYPVVIDLETFFQGIGAQKLGSTAFYESLKYLNTSVLYSGLLPNKLMHSDRSRLNGLEMSALSGDVQNSQQRVERVKYLETDEMKIEPDEFTVEGKLNIPKLKGEKVNYWSFRDEIIFGINTFYAFVLERKVEILDLIKNQFEGENIFVRNVLKGTQNYSDYLHYSLHPSCMKDMVEREKVLENLWAISYNNLQVVKHEVQDLIKGDIPLFTSNIHDRNIYSSNGIMIENVLNESTYEYVFKSIIDLNQQKILEHVAVAKISLGYFEDYIPIKQEWKPEHYQNNYSFSYLDIQQAAIDKSREIADHIIDQAIYGEDNATVNFIEPIFLNSGWKLYPMNNDVYDGLSGMYIFFHDLGLAIKDDRYMNFSNVILNTIINQTTFEENLSGYAGRSSILLPLLREYRHTKDSHWRNIALEITDSICQVFEKELTLDWITGVTSLVPVLEDWLEETADEIFLKLLNELTSTISLNNTYDENIEGLGHSHAGALMTINKVSSELRQHYVRKIINQARHSLLNNPKKNDLKVCNGILGSLLLLKEFDYDIYEDDILDIVKEVGSLNYSEDSLCHGNAGIVDVLIHILEISRQNNTVKHALSKKAQELIKPINDYSIRGISPYTSKSLFSGLAGIGHSLVRLYSEDTPSVWTIKRVNKNIWQSN